jgi:hypothetical protein
MLPGFRFLFAAIVLSISTLVFGLGAAALLRASHERFASLPVLPSPPALPPAATADASSHDATPSTLALLQVDTPEPDAALTPRAAPTPVSDPAAPAAETKEIAAAPTTAAATSEPSKTTETAAPTPETTQATSEAALTQPETPRPEPTTNPPDIAKAEPAQTQPVEAQPAQAEPITRTEPAQPEPAKSEPASVSAAALAPAEVARPAPLEPADAPITTAMLAPTEPAPSAIPDPVVTITGPIPLPRSREWALAQGHAAHRQPVRKRTAAVRARPRAVVRQARPAAQTPASAPNLLFPFGQ